ncbi:vacuolar protein sorting-associated protein 11 homolog [Lepeophtheirus salmonis]|uniref:vacuolar protein sorting-associated protein 11 homolog n=1 Tax=Lepeophtheirus salmonis TaxID=72036 RepID=UPI001AE9F00B|nr:vacuolar protein sorting-associated protein 11 homolog [Lepeophtheirus salmonis]
MSNFQWRRFNFFEFSKEVQGGNLAELLEDSVVTTTTSGRGHLILGDSSGFLHYLGRNDLTATTLRIFDVAVLHAQQLKQSGICILVGLDHHPSDPNISIPYLKAYNSDKIDPKTGHPTYLRSSKIATNSDVTALAVHENQNLIALGFGDGSLQLWRGDVSRGRGARLKNLTLGMMETSVTGIALRTGAQGTFLYASSQNDVYSFNVTTKDKEIKVHLDSKGCRKGLAITVDLMSETHFVVGRTDAVYCYNAECCTHCYAFEGEKSNLYWFRNYLVIASSSEGDKDVVISIFDVQNKFIAYSGEVPKVSALLSEWGNLYVLSENKLYVLIEKDTQTKLDILFKKNFYDIAIKIAKNQRYDADGLVDIFRQYGDHLYVKGDYSGAIDNYCKTIGQLEPSYVIRRFLDAQRIDNLTAYLQVLHRRGAANEDHTTLLLNCYTKLKDEDKLNEFIMTEDREVDFDLDIAIKVCRQAGYFEHALALAKKHEKHDWVLKIQLEDRKNYSQAVEYISKLDPLSVEKSLRKYGSILVSVLPEETTEMAVESCKNGGVLPEDYIHLFIIKPKQMVTYLEKIIELESDEVSPQIYNTLLEYYLALLPESEVKVLDLLRTQNCNLDQALILCKNASCKSGLLYLYEKKRIYDEILVYHVREGDTRNALETCRKFGDEDRQLWVSALRLIPNDPNATSEIMSEILERIESLKLMSPLEVISTLTSTSGATLGLVRDYLLKYIESEQQVIDENQRAITEYQAETEKIKNKIDSLENGPIVFQCSKCSACSKPLDLPSVHFLCKHSFHKLCVASFSDNENECPVCFSENKNILDIIKSQESNKTAHEAFHYQLETAQDGFSLVAEYFGRGLFRGDEDLLSIINEAAKNMSHDKSILNSLSNNVGLQSESRIRMGEGKSNGSSGVLSYSSEARLRLDQGSMNTNKNVSESRLRSQAPSSVPQTVSDARLRLNEGSKVSLCSNTSQNSNASSQGSKSRKSLPENDFNPFDEEDSTAPFDKKNPFYSEPVACEVTTLKVINSSSQLKQEEASGNPFGNDDNDEKDDDYDESLNPFS